MIDRLAINGGDPVINQSSARFEWPIIDSEAEKAVLGQLHTSISIYDRSGVIEEFEEAFSKYHKREYGLLSNSGTSAIFSMYEAINLQPGDEVLCPVYTFHATVSPMMYMGAVPIFCDSDDEGNMSFESLKSKLTNKTKAVIVTHMWGVPLRDIEKIKDFCKKNKLILFEDCSHAHGASIYGRKVGSFGDAASWSLQGPKIISGGEGGIMLTDNKKIYTRALLQGHYNKRPLQEVDKDDPLRDYSLTGLGLKLRSHPLAVALALQQFRHLDEFIIQKQKYAELFNEALSVYEFITVPEIKPNVQNSWYAYNFKFNSEAAYGISREEYVDALVAEGLVEVDIPGSTGVINELPLFTNPEKIIGRMYHGPLVKQTGFTNAVKFQNSIIKLPVWATSNDINIVQAYIKGITKVSNYIRKNKSLN